MDNIKEQSIGRFKSVENFTNDKSDVNEINKDKSNLKNDKSFKNSQYIEGKSNKEIKRVQFQNRVLSVVEIESYKKFNSKIEEKQDNNVGCSVCITF